MNKFFKDWLIVLIAGTFISALGLSLRLYRLDLLPVFADEAIYIRWAQIMKAESTLRFLPLSDGKQPLFMWSVIPSLKIFSDPLFAGRVVSVITGLSTAVGLFLIGKVLFRSSKLGLVASFIWAISAFSVFFDRMALVDSMLTMFGVWTFFFAALTARTLRVDFAMLTGFALGGAYLTKSPALFFVILLPTLWVFAPWRGDWRSSLKVFVKLVFLAGVSYLLTFGMYNILRLGPNFHLISLRNKDYVLPLSHLWTNPKDPFIFHFDRAIEWLLALGPSLLVPLFVLGMFLGLARKPKETVALFLWGALPILAQSEYAKVFTARYILFSLPFLVFISSFFAEYSEGLLKRISVIIFIAFIFQSFSVTRFFLTDIEKAPLPRSERSGYLEEWTSGTGIKEASEVLREFQKEDPGKKIVVGTEGYFGTLPDGLQMYLNDLPQITIIGVGLGIKEIPINLLESREAGNKTYLLINSSRLNIKEPETVGLKLVAAYPKAFRLDSETHEYLWYGPSDKLYLFEVKTDVSE